VADTDCIWNIIEESSCEYRYCNSLTTEVDCTNPDAACSWGGADGCVAVDGNDPRSYPPPCNTGGDTREACEALTPFNNGLKVCVWETVPTKDSTCIADTVSGSGDIPDEARVDGEAPGEVDAGDAGIVDGSGAAATRAFGITVLVVGTVWMV
jgi:hypothetical protein